MSNEYPRLGQGIVKGARLAALLSQFFNLALCNGSPDETLSGRAYRQGFLQGGKGWNRTRKVINFVVFWQTDHCYTSHLQDVEAAKSLRDIYRLFKP